MAAEIATQRDADKIDEVNVSGTRRLLEACVAAGRPRFVFVSTVVTGDAGGCGAGRVVAVQTAYGRSKQEGELLVRESGLPSDIATAVVDAAADAPDGALYHVVDDAPISYYDFVALTARGAPRRVPVGLPDSPLRSKLQVEGTLMEFDVLAVLPALEGEDLEASDAYEAIDIAKKLFSHGANQAELPVRPLDGLHVDAATHDRMAVPA